MWARCDSYKPKDGKLKIKILVGSLCVGAVVASYFIAEHYNKKNEPIHSQIVNWGENLFKPKAEVVPLLGNELNIARTPKNYIPKKTNITEDKCENTALGKLSYRKNAGVYSWVDENGTANFSDIAPTVKAFELLDFAGAKVFEYFSLNLNTESLPKDFNEKLTDQLITSFKVYGKLLDISELKKVDVNLRIYTSKRVFDGLKKQNNVAQNSKKLGFYNHVTNQGHLLYTEPSETMRVASHEAAHAITRGVVGYTPKWLNEGLAEYIENVQLGENNTTVEPNQEWLQNQQLQANLIPLKTLFASANRDWYSGLRSNLYATSWAFVYFMMEQEPRRTMLANIIKAEQQSMCNVLDDKIIEQILLVPISELQQDFDRWASNQINAQKV